MLTMNSKGNFVDRCLSATLIALVLMLIWWGFTLSITRTQYAVLFLCLSFIISSLAIVQGGSFLKLRGKWLAGLAILLIASSIAPAVYLFLEFEALLMFRAGAYSNIDLVFGILILFPLLLLTWREGGTPLLIIVLVFAFYSYFGDIFPGILHHRGLSFTRIIGEDVLTFDGLHGIVLCIVSTWVAIFLVYAGLIRGFGALEVIIKVLLVTFRRRRVLLPQVPVVASLIFGSFSGAATANVAGTGSFTIPMMKRFGLPAKLAGAIESVASSGGQVMPPIMGATAFLMCTFLGVSYLHIVLIGFIPAILFYMAVAFSVHHSTRPYLTKADPLAGSSEEMATVSRSELARLIPLGVSIIVVFTELALLTPIMTACLHGILVLLATQLVYELSVNFRRKSLWRILYDFVRNLVNGMKLGALPAANIAIIGGAMGLIIRVLIVTALGVKLSFGLVELSQGILPLLLFLSLILCILFGMAVSTLAVYILAVFCLAPALTDFGIPLVATHFMVFYLGNMSMITPPVAPAVIVASGIAGTDFMGTAWRAVKLGLPLFLLGIVFVYHPELLTLSYQGLITFIFTAIGLIGIAYAIHLPENKNWKPILKRAVCFIAGFLTLFYQAQVVYIPAAIIIAALLAVEFWLGRLRSRVS